jgi:hypothetical protein
MRRGLHALVLAGALTVAACAAIPSTRPDATVDPTTSTSLAATTSTTAMDATGDETGQTGSGVDAPAIWVVLGLVSAFVLLGWLMGRTRRPSPPAAVTTPTWKDHLRDGYGEALWLREGMTEELAVWRGNSLADPTSETAGTAMSDRWGQVDVRMSRARNHLRRAEAAAPDPTAARSIGDCVQRLDAVRASLDARAQARLQAFGLGDSASGDRERIASANLTESLAALDEALESISGLV